MRLLLSESVRMSVFSFSIWSGQVRYLYFSLELKLGYAILLHNICPVCIKVHKSCWEMVKSPHVAAISKSQGKLGSEKQGQIHTQHTCQEPIWFHSSRNIATAFPYRTSALDVTCNRRSWWCFVVSLWAHRSEPTHDKEQKMGIWDEKAYFPNIRESTSVAVWPKGSITFFLIFGNMVGKDEKHNCSPKSKHVRATGLSPRMLKV